MLPVKKLNKFVREMNYERLPSSVLKYAKLCLLDTIGCTIAGAHKGTANRQLGKIKTINPLQEATLIGRKIKVPTLDAFRVNAYACSRKDLKRGRYFRFMHPGRLLILSALATGEELNVSYKELLTAIVLGYEVITRVGRAVRPIGWPLDEARPDPATSLVCFTLSGITDVAMNLLNMNMVDYAEIGIGPTHSENIIQQHISSSSTNTIKISYQCLALLPLQTNGSYYEKSWIRL
ncbi:MmgE/PrpD family protein [Chloroflexota bacterium]